MLLCPWIKADKHSIISYININNISSRISPPLLTIIKQIVQSFTWWIMGAVTRSMRRVTRHLTEQNRWNWTFRCRKQTAQLAYLPVMWPQAKSLIIKLTKQKWVRLQRCHHQRRQPPSWVDHLSILVWLIHNSKKTKAKDSRVYPSQVIRCLLKTLTERKIRQTHHQLWHRHQMQITSWLTNKTRALVIQGYRLEEYQTHLNLTS